MGARKPKGLNRIEIIWYGHLYLREENLRVNNKYMIWGNWFICCWQRKYTKYRSKQLFELLPSKWKLIISCFKKCIMMKWRYINTISQPKPNQNNKTTKVIKGDNKSLCHIANLICVKNNYNNWKHKNKNFIYFFQTMLSSPLLKQMFVWCCLSMPFRGL